MFNSIKPKPQAAAYVPYELEGQTIDATGGWPSARKDQNPASYGHDFNLIKAVEDYGPQRIAQINKRLDEITKESERLSTERSTLERLIAALK